MATGMPFCAQNRGHERRKPFQPKARCLGFSMIEIIRLNLLLVSTNQFSGIFVRDGILDGCFRNGGILERIKEFSRFAKFFPSSLSVNFRPDSIHAFNVLVQVSDTCICQVGAWWMGDHQIPAIVQHAQYIALDMGPGPLAGP